MQPLRGAHGFKETGRYAPRVAMGPQKLGLRLAAFPFIGEENRYNIRSVSYVCVFHGCVCVCECVSAWSHRESSLLPYPFRPAMDDSNCFLV